VGLKVQNLDEYVITLRSAGTLTAAVNKDCAISPIKGWLRNLFAIIETPGTGATATTLDVNLNTVSIFSSSGISLAATTGVATYGALSSDPLAVAAGDVFSLDIDGISTSPKNVVVSIVISKRPAAVRNVQDHSNIG